MFNYIFLANSVCGNDFAQHIPLRKPRRSQNKLKPILIIIIIIIITDTNTNTNTTYAYWLIFVY